MAALINTLIETERLILRPFELTDAPDVYRLATNKDINRYTLDSPVVDKEDAIELITKVFHADYAKHGYGRLAVIHKADNLLIGFCGLKFLPEYEKADIGYRFFPEYWGKGYATESSLAAIDYGRNVLKLEGIFGLVFPDNIASAKVLEKLGLNYVKDVVEDGVTVKWYE